MNSIAFLQQAAQLDSKNIFRRVIDAALSSDTAALLEWQRFDPALFALDIPRHSPIYAKKINLPYYALLSDVAQEATLEELAKQYAEEFGLNFTYVTEGDAGVISVYVCSHEVDNDTLFELLDDDEDAHGFPPVDEDDDYDYLEDPQLLVGCDVEVDGELRTVADFRDNEDEEMPDTDFIVILDNGQEIPVEEIERNEDDEYVYMSEEYRAELESAKPLNLVDNDDDDDDDDFEVESPVQTSANVSPTAGDDDEDDEDDAFETESSANAPEVLVPQIREGEQAPKSETGDDDFPEEQLQPQSSAGDEKPEVTEEQALAAAVAEEQAAQASNAAEPAPIDWTKPPVEPVSAQAPASPVEGADDTFAEEPQGEVSKPAENEAQAPAAPVAETATAEPAFRVIDDERVSVAEFDRRSELLVSIRDQLPNDSVSEITDGILSVLIVKDDGEYELSVKIIQQLFAGQKMIDVFVLGSKDGSIGRRASNTAAIIDAINSL